MRTETPSRWLADSSGVAFDPSRHVAPDARTKTGLFKLKPGQRRFKD